MSDQEQPDEGQKEDEPYVDPNSGAALQPGSAYKTEEEPSSEDAIADAVLEHQAIDIRSEGGDSDSDDSDEAESDSSGDQPQAEQQSAPQKRGSRRK